MSDVEDGDLVLVQARLAKGTRFAAPTARSTPPAIVARKLIDKTNAPQPADEPAA